MRAAKQKECNPVCPPHYHTFSRIGKTRALALALTACMALALVPVFTLTGSAAEVVVKVSDYDGDLRAAIEGAAEKVVDQYTVIIDADITLTATPTTIIKPFIIKSDGTARTITRGVTGDLITVQTDGSLTLENIIIDGNSETYSNSTGSLVRVEVKGKFTMNDGAVLQNNKTTQGGGGVFVNGGEFTMTGGEISGNTSINGSGGVSIGVGTSTFNMTGGKISGNKANYGGGVYVDGKFIMTGGEISGNKASVSDSGGGGGVYVSGTFTVGGKAKITGNTVGKSKNNVYLPGLTGIAIGTTPDEVMKIGIYAENSARDIATSNVYVGYEQYFTADDADKMVVYQDYRLIIVNAWTITYNANGGTGTMDADKVAESSDYTVKPNDFTNSTAFLNWNTEADGSGTDYAADDEIETVTANITLYAQWAAEPPPPDPDPQPYRVEYYVGNLNTPLPESTKEGKTTFMPRHRLTPRDVSDDFPGWLDPPEDYGVALVSYPTITEGENVVKVLYMER